MVSSLVMMFSLSFVTMNTQDVRAANKEVQDGGMLATAHDTFTYYSPYGNAPPATGGGPGFVDIEMEGLLAPSFTSAPMGEVLDVYKIEEYFYISPNIDPSTLTKWSDYDWSVASTVREIDPSKAVVYNPSTKRLRIVLTPQRMVDGGCTVESTGGCKWDRSSSNPLK